jgi:hypothetical protein
MTDKVDIGTEIGRGWELFKANMGLLILVNLIAGILGVFTCGILLGPMMAGNFLIIQRLLKKDPAVPLVGDVFKGLSYFLNTFLCILAFGIIAGIISFIPLANLILIAFGAILSVSIMFVVFGKLGFADALKKVFQEIGTGPFWMLVLTIVIAHLIAGVGGLLCGIGALFTAPLGACICVCAYHSAYEGTATTSEPPPPLEPAS